MKEERKATIINEIKYWRENKLLPPTYCDFLLMLYTEGNEKFISKKKKSPWSLIFFILFIIGVMVLYVIVTYFTSLSLQVQIIVQLLLIISVFLLTYYIKGKDAVLFHICLSIGVLFVFFLSIHLVSSYSENNLVLALTVLFHCAGWVIIGLFERAAYLKWSGSIGMILTIVVILLH